MEAARAVLAGRSFTEGEEDPFEGLGPKEIQEYIDKALQGVSHSDPFEVRALTVHLKCASGNSWSACIALDSAKLLTLPLCELGTMLTFFRC